jgi:hypothetical protein
MTTEKATTYDKLEEGLSALRRTFTYVGKDDFTQDYLNEDNEARFLPGAGSLYHYPGGYINFNKENMWLYDLLQLYLIEKYNMIPVAFVKDMPRFISFKRSSGAINRGLVSPTCSLTFSESNNDFKTHIKFNAEGTEEYLTDFSQMEKCVYISEVMLMNDITELNIEVKYSENTEKETKEIETKVFIKLEHMLNKFNEAHAPLTLRLAYK